MLLFNAIMILLLSGHYFAQGQDDTNITPNYCPRMGFTLWSNLTLTCSRNCSPQAESDLDIWHFQPGENLLLIQLDLYNYSFNYSIISDNQPIINDFEDHAGVNLRLTNNNTEDSCNAGEVIEYSLAIENTRRSIDGLVVTCGARKIENGETTHPRTSNSTVLYLKSQITTYTAFKRAVTSGSRTTVNCTRERFPNREDSIHNRLRLQLQGETFEIDENKNFDAKIVAFLNETGITLELNTSPNTCAYSGFVNYTLTIGNITQNVDGMLIKCGAIDTSSLTNNHDQWYADHSVKLVLHNTTELEAKIVQLERCESEKNIIRDNITELEATIVAAMAQLEECNAENRVTIGVIIGTILLVALIILLIVTIIIILKTNSRSIVPCSSSNKNSIAPATY